MYDHILKAMLFGFYPHRNAFPGMLDAIVQGIESFGQTKVATYEAVLQTLTFITSTPVLLIFDETNAIFDTELVFWQGHLAFEHPLFKVTASTLNILDMRRGLKLLSGTGHSEGLKHLARGCEHFTHCLSLPSKEELKNMILHSNLFPDVPRGKILGLSNNQKQFDRVIKAIISIIGCIPREVRSFGKYIDANSGNRKYKVSFWIEMIKEFSTNSGTEAFNNLVGFYNQLDDTHKKIEFIRNLNLVFFWKWPFNFSCFCRPFVHLSTPIRRAVSSSKSNCNHGYCKFSSDI